MELSAPGTSVPILPGTVADGASQNGNKKHGRPDPVTLQATTIPTTTVTTATAAPSFSSSDSSAPPNTKATVSLWSTLTPQVLESPPINFQERLILQPYSFESFGNEPSIPANVIQLWIDVGNGIDNTKTVGWKSAVDSLEFGKKYNVSSDARHFVELYAGPIIHILVSQQPRKICVNERNCVQEALTLASLLVVKDLSIQLERGFFGECTTIDTVLSHVFCKRSPYYKAHNVNEHQVGLQEVRLRNVERFRLEGGFQLLTRYLEDKVAYQQYYNATVRQHGVPSRVPASLMLPCSLFPTLYTLHHILHSLFDSIRPRTNSVAGSMTQHITNPRPTRGDINQPLASTSSGTLLSGGTPPPPADKARENDAVAVAAAIMKYIHNATEDELEEITTDGLSTIINRDLQPLFDILTCRQDTYQFYTFWRALALKLISSKSLPLKLFGWEQVVKLIEACAAHAPPPRQYQVQGAGCAFVNGIYHYAGQTTPDGYAKHGSDILYSKTVSPEIKLKNVATPNHSSLDENPIEAPTSSARIVGSRRSAGKKLTLFRCTMRSQQKWWFISEADEEQPGTDNDIDYYQHKPKEHEESLPPRTGWITSRSAGMNPPPTLEPQGVMVPHGKEYDTLEHQLATWAIDNEIVESVLGDSTVHREILARSTVLIKFLASMCNKDDDVSQDSEKLSVSSTSDTKINNTVGKPPSIHGLQPSHLLCAWKTCTQKADDAAVTPVEELQVLPEHVPMLNSEVTGDETTIISSSVGITSHNNENATELVARGVTVNNLENKAVSDSDTMDTNSDDATSNKRKASVFEIPVSKQGSFRPFFNAVDDSTDKYLKFVMTQHQLENEKQEIRERKLLVLMETEREERRRERDERREEERMRRQQMDLQQQQFQQMMQLMMMRMVSNNPLLPSNQLLPSTPTCDSLNTTNQLDEDVAGPTSNDK